MQLNNRPIAQVLTFPNLVTLTEGQSHSTWNHAVQFSRLVSYQIWNKSVHMCPEAGQH